MPLNKTLIIKYTNVDDDDANVFMFHLMISIDVDQGRPEKPDISMDSSMVTDCGVKFKKYNSSGLVGELDRSKVDINSIDQDYIDGLNGELDNKYSIDDNFEIIGAEDTENETGDEPKEEES